MQRQPSRYALGFIMFTLLLDTISFGIIAPVLPQLLVELTGETVVNAAGYGGLLLFVYALMQFLFAPVMGSLSDRFGRRPVLLLTLLLLGLDYLVMGLAPTLGWLFVTRALAGVCGAVYPVANAYVTDISAPEHRARRFALLGAAWSVGFIIGPLVGGLLGELGPRVPFFAAAGLCLVNVLYGYLVLPESLSVEHRRPFQLRRGNPLGALLQLRSYPFMLLFMFGLFLFQVAHDTNPSIWSFYTIHRFDWTPRMVGLSLATVGVASTLVMVLVIPLFLRWVGEYRTALVGYAFGASGFICMSLLPGGWGWMVFALIPPWMLMGMINPPLRSMLTRRVPTNAQGELQGALSSLAGLSMILTPLMMTQIFQLFASERAPLLFPGAPYLLAGVLMFGSALVVARAHRLMLGAEA